MKRAIRVNMLFSEVTTKIKEYTCPSCKTNIRGVGISIYVTRFKCFRCNRELIVNSWHKKDGE